MSQKNYEEEGRSWRVHFMAIDYLFNTKIFSLGRGCTSVHDKGGGAAPTLT
jgi:hypothetical protein